MVTAETDYLLEMERVVARNLKTYGLQVAAFELRAVKMRVEERLDGVRGDMRRAEADARAAGGGSLDFEDWPDDCVKRWQRAYGAADALLAEDTRLGIRIKELTVQAEQLGAEWTGLPWTP